MNPPGVPQRAARARRWAGLFSFGLIEQVLLSGGNFVLTAAMAHYLGVFRFGWWSIGWAVVMLLESASVGLFGDGVPAVARRLPPARQAEFRGAYLAWSALVSLVLLGGALAVAGVMAALGRGQPWVIVASGAAYCCWRAQNAMRRLFYLEGLRREAALAAVVWSMVLALATLAMRRRGGEPSAALAMAIPGIASLAAAAAMFVRQRQLPVRWPGPALLGWTLDRLWRGGRWLVATNLMSYAGNLGFVLVVGALMGAAASGTLRVVATLTVPPAQLVLVMNSIMVPRVAALAPADLATRARRIALGVAGLLLAVNGSYALAVTAAAPRLLPLMFSHSAEAVTRTIVAIAIFGFALESLRNACNVVTLSQGDTRTIMVGQTLALVVALVLVPVAIHWGLVYVVTAMTLANNLNTLVVVRKFIKKTAR